MSEDIKTKSKDFGDRFLKFKNDGNDWQAWSTMHRWEAWRDTLSGKDRDDCVDAMVEVCSVLPEDDWQAFLDGEEQTE